MWSTTGVTLQSCRSRSAGQKGKHLADVGTLGDQFVSGQRLILIVRQFKCITRAGRRDRTPSNTMTYQDNGPAIVDLYAYSDFAATKAMTLARARRIRAPLEKTKRRNTR